MENPELSTKKRVSKSTARRVFLDPSTPSVRSIVRVVILTLLILYVAGVAANILYALTHLIFLILLSIFFAYLISPLVSIIRRPFKERHLEKLMPRALAIGIAYIFVFSILGIAISYLAPRVAEQAREFASNVPAYATAIQERAKELNTRYENYQVPEEVQVEINRKINEKAIELTSVIPAFVGGVALSVVSYLPGVILIPILSFFFLKDVNLFRVSFLKAFPSGRWRARAEMVLADVNNTLAAYARAQLVSCIVIGGICTVAFSIFDINYALLLGIMAGIFEFVPLIGPLTIGITATMVAGVSGSPWTALSVAVFLIILRILQDYVLYPRIVRETFHLHPLVIILSILGGEQVAGAPGIFLSIPLVALLMVFYKHVLEHSGKRGLFAELLTPEKPEPEPEPSLIIQDTSQT